MEFDVEIDFRFDLSLMRSDEVEIHRSVESQFELNLTGFS